MAEIKKRLLTKSRFKLALDCPTKLYYTRKPEYENQSKSDTFLEALAQGGFQVEELARMAYTDGIAILEDDFNYEALASRTQELLMREQVVIFEAALLFNGLFIRTDILIKKGKQIQLLEVKAKSVSGRVHNGFSLTGSWSAYLYDVAFQHYVIQQVHPDFIITPFLNLVDKDKTATINGLNQKFKLVSDNKLRTGIAVEPGLTKTDLGESILAKINIETEIQKIFNENPLFEGSSFQETIFYFKKHYSEDIKIYTPIGNHCKGCEFYTETPSKFSKSGFHECWQEQLNHPENEISKPKTFEVWNWRSSKKVMEEGR
ncbi:hypothetical protein [Flavimarina sp. Hel_I_48]|uniref:hypothetical protein n=1 Tax=Flavimarina sp. Hel_I_48 TaxID=1392488 RepID=UPI000A5E7EB5|nr:hypothetical protein [Flavimarina sp. Hel_I_48]